jgi:hypothetical protein
MVRANPGYMLLKDGVIQGKWSWATLPEKEWFLALTSNKVPATEYGNRSAFIVLILITSLLLILSILGINIYKYFFIK